MPALLDLLLPPACASCGTAGALLCGRCFGTFEPPFQPQDRFVARDGGVVIGDHLALAIAAFAYAGPVRRALAALKYKRIPRLARPLADAATPALHTVRAISGPAALVPVPVHLDRLRERGYDQAELIARALGRAAQMPVATPLVRLRPTAKQHRLDRAARLANLRDAFRIVAPSIPPVVILVDDIITTTATLEVCAAALRQAGATAVYGVAIAREV